ncbi:alpha/beta hydrolase family protein [Nakamurella endophytica]|uniref:Alpha/beta hydrolase n=1 Tax=Nakamurella endophytica TaxID=1748367 RepID=A0A917T4P8_9ACTN|nr:alpha/beta family hydrolase [Nakamurella endophytica]GGM11007.1 alpha/beta hydrolase [Nakamurella endophytica]
MVAGALLLTPGAGAGRDHHTLVAVERAVAPLPCERVDFPYRLAGRRSPDRPEVAVAHLRTAAAGLAARADVPADRLVLGGRSFGGRMCSMAVAEGLPAAGLVLLSYPLHPPGKPDRLRVAHWPEIRVPVLFVSGRSDPFGSPDEFAAQLSAVAGPVTQVWLPGGHQPSAPDGRIGEIVRDWCSGL